MRWVNPEAASTARPLPPAGPRPSRSTASAHNTTEYYPNTVIKYLDRLRYLSIVRVFMQFWTRHGMKEQPECRLKEMELTRSILRPRTGIEPAVVTIGVHCLHESPLCPTYHAWKSRLFIFAFLHKYQWINKLRNANDNIYLEGSSIHSLTI